ncbi:MAG: glycosyltransferase [Dehalococcoidia bacterium]
MTTYVMVSLTKDSAARMLADGPRRDLLEVARELGATVDYAPASRQGAGWRRRLLGAHVRQAWALARRVRTGDTVLADGEHTGLPLLLFLALRRRRPRRVVVIGHLVSRPWKLAALAVVTRIGAPGVLVLHSVEQRRRVARRLGRRWSVALVPYQVDTRFWTGIEERSAEPRSRVVAVGSEHRDYETLARAAAGLDADVVIAAGSHWARTRAGLAAMPPNVQFVDQTLGFVELRELYRSAAVVAVPLHDVPNQSGVTTILEAMSCGVPVVVTATAGQRECISGPLVEHDGQLEVSTQFSHGPHVLGAAPAPTGQTGLYVRPGDAAGLRHALEQLVADDDLARAAGGRARQVAEDAFSIEQFVETFAALLNHAAPAQRAMEREAVVA